MIPLLPAIGLPVLGYLIGSIPTAYLLVRARTGQDIRALGSGNVGATNAGRVLGRWAFWLVFVVDLLKGLITTVVLPILAARWFGGPEATYRVLVALATILGHNFPVYLGFRGGKGVATSLGAVLAIDPIAAAVSMLVFGLSLGLTRIVSISSILGALGFGLSHFARTARPWSSEQAPTSVALLALLTLIVVRHRTNLQRLIAGTEPRIGTRTRLNGDTGSRPPGGFVRLSVSLGLAVLSLLGVWTGVRQMQPDAVTCAGVTFTTECRVQTGHQRAERLCFLDAGRQLAVACPRYDRVVLYHVTDRSRLELGRELRVEGKPVSLAPTRDHLIILQRPSGDARHLEPGFLQVYDFRTERLGPRVPVGYDPDDLILLDDDRAALVLLSGHAEGETNRPDPAVIALDLSDPDAPQIVDLFTLDPSLGDPARLLFDAASGQAVVLCHDGKGPAWLKAERSDDPSVRSWRLAPGTPTGPTDPVPGRVGLDLLRETADWTAMVPAPSGAGTEGATWSVLAPGAGSSLQIHSGAGSDSAAALPLRGPFRMGRTTPMGVSWCPERRLLAASDRSGGVHLIRVTP